MNKPVKIKKDGTPDLRGGIRKGQGRKPKAVELRSNEIMNKAIKEIFGKDNTDEAKIEFIKQLMITQRGMIFIAEHVFGKSPDHIKIEGGDEPIKFKLTDLIKID